MLNLRFSFLCCFYFELEDSVLLFEESDFLDVAGEARIKGSKQGSKSKKGQMVKIKSNGRAGI